jgi:DNA-binding response OmpR family regulator
MHRTAICCRSARRRARTTLRSHNFPRRPRRLPRRPPPANIFFDWLQRTRAGASAWIVDTLAECGFSVTSAESFAQGKARILESPPTLLVAELRLREYNGLQLVLRGKARRPSMAAIVLSSILDSVLQSEAETMGATFVVRPVDSRELIAAAFRTLLREPARHPVVDPIRSPFERRTGERRFLLEDDGNNRTTERRRDRVTLLTFAARRD